MSWSIESGYSHTCHDCGRTYTDSDGGCDCRRCEKCGAVDVRGNAKCQECEWEIGSEYDEDIERLKDTINVLKAHNEWRRGGDGEATNPKILGVALDDAITFLKEILDERS